MCHSSSLCMRLLRSEMGHDLKQFKSMFGKKESTIMAANKEHPTRMSATDNELRNAFVFFLVPDLYFP